MPVRTTADVPRVSYSGTDTREYAEQPCSAMTHSALFWENSPTKAPCCAQVHACHAWIAWVCEQTPRTNRRKAKPNQSGAEVGEAGVHLVVRLPHIRARGTVAKRRTGAKAWVVARDFHAAPAYSTLLQGSGRLRSGVGRLDALEVFVQRLHSIVRVNQASGTVLVPHHRRLPGRSTAVRLLAEDQAEPHITPCASTHSAPTRRAARTRTECRWVDSLAPIVT